MRSAVLLSSDWELPPSDPNDLTSRDYVDGEVVLALRSQEEIGDLNAFVAERAWPTSLRQLVADRFTVDYRYTDSGGAQLAVGHLELPPDRSMSVPDWASQLAAQPNVAWAEPNYWYAIEDEYTPNDKVFDPTWQRYDPANRWHLDKMEVPAAWDIEKGSSRVLIAVLDKVYINHEDLQGNLVAGHDFVDNDADPAPGPKEKNPGHGTYVAGIAAARMDNGKGIAGVAGLSRVMPLRIRTAKQIGQALDFAVNAVKDDPNLDRLIVNMSFNTDKHIGDAAFVTALDRAYTADALIVNSAGNGGRDDIGDPDTPRQSTGQMLLVAGTGRDDGKSYNSNFGQGVDIAAPGLEMLGPGNPPDGYSIPGKPGTSSAAPCVAGVAALVWSEHPTWTRDQVVAQLLATADGIDTAPGNTRFTGGLGAGRVNARRALQENAAPFPTPQAVGPAFKGGELKRGVTGSLLGIHLRFNQVLDPATVAVPANYVFTFAGSNGVFGDLNDQDLSSRLFPLPYVVADNAVRLSITDSALPLGEYRLSFKPDGLQNPFKKPIQTDRFFSFRITSGQGRTGDVIQVDLKGTSGGYQFFLATGVHDLGPRSRNPYPAGCEWRRSAERRRRQ